MENETKKVIINKVFTTIKEMQEAKGKMVDFYEVRGEVLKWARRNEEIDMHELVTGQLINKSYRFLLDKGYIKEFRTTIKAVERRMARAGGDRRYNKAVVFVGVAK